MKPRDFSHARALALLIGVTPQTTRIIDHAIEHPEFARDLVFDYAVCGNMFIRFHGDTPIRVPPTEVRFDCITYRLTGDKNT